ncbi:hypothetical protein [Haladaptatus cibarius]|uniref:hypothetical protein n=1 Tax=Haladaptatus cibarius TaxID=453847 RepID=UPI000A0206A9|nr:hypothetical protein [Haladaptatus cibarius]
MTNPLFSTYTQGENRVTSTLISVLQHVNSSLTTDILEALTDESDLSLLSFENQVTGVKSVPDAAIRSSSAIWFETKTARDAVRKEQLENHLLALDEDGAELQRLVVLTPDGETPRAVAALDDERLVWANFDDLVDVVEGIMARDIASTEETTAVPTEREAFLLRELARFVYDEDLVSGKEDRVLVVAARRAWPEYQAHGLYYCQPGRSFKPVEHLAFYTDGEVKTAVPRVIGRVDDVLLTEEGIEDANELTDEQREQLRQVLDPDWERYGERQQVLFLADDLELSQSVRNDKTASESDRTVAFVQGHRYVSFSDLQAEPATTTELED